MHMQFLSNDYIILYHIHTFESGHKSMQIYNKISLYYVYARPASADNLAHDVGNLISEILHAQLVACGRAMHMD
jgi:hypothetical protein